MPGWDVAVLGSFCASGILATIAGISFCSGAFWTRLRSGFGAIVLLSRDGAAFGPSAVPDGIRRLSPETTGACGNVEAIRRTCSLSCPTAWPVGKCPKCIAAAFCASVKDGMSRKKRSIRSTELASMNPWATFVDSRKSPRAASMKARARQAVALLGCNKGSNIASAASFCPASDKETAWRMMRSSEVDAVRASL